MIHLIATALFLTGGAYLAGMAAVSASRGDVVRELAGLALALTAFSLAITAWGIQ